tara:strand:+ start:95 stop:298 length:204 start_codon:yes stop_codon:yes gene_type:complete
MTREINDGVKRRKVSLSYSTLVIHLKDAYSRGFSEGRRAESEESCDIDLVIEEIEEMEGIKLRREDD